MKGSITPTIQKNKPLSEYTTFAIGGPADYLLEAKTPEEFQEGFLFANEYSLPCLVLGKGSNCLIDERGFKGIVIVNKLSFLERHSEVSFTVGSGYSFSLLGSKTARWNLSGLEFASGIPGSVGGAVYMNAGANGRETCEFLDFVQFLKRDGSILTYSSDQITFSYRKSSFHEMEGAILSASFTLTPLSSAREAQLRILSHRKQTQPLQENSAGCVFRNPEQGHSGAIIEACGLKGTRVGGAVVSTVHANFIVNAGDATASDVLTLANLIRDRVREKTGQELEFELRYIPYE